MSIDLTRLYVLAAIRARVLLHGYARMDDSTTGTDWYGADRMAWLKKHGITLILIIILVTGVGLIAYPSVADYWNELHQAHAISGYAANLSHLKQDEYDRIIQDAEDYNQNMAATGIKQSLSDEEEQEYESLLKTDGSGIMGYITIPKINVFLPIYHGIDDTILETSIGHLEGTSLPVGGAGSHCVLIGHRGMPSAKLFSDLDQMEEGDRFTLTVLNETLTYEVDQIHTVLPDDWSDLQIEEGKDYCTLLTCTPYGVNTHRLLVRGHRVENADGDARVIAEAIQMKPIYTVPVVAVPMVIVLIVVYLLLNGSGRNRKSIKERYLEKMHISGKTLGSGSKINRMNRDKNRNDRKN